MNGLRDIRPKDQSIGCRQRQFLAAEAKVTLSRSGHDERHEIVDVIPEQFDREAATVADVEETEIVLAVMFEFGVSLGAPARRNELVRRYDVANDILDLVQSGCRKTTVGQRECPPPYLPEPASADADSFHCLKRSGDAAAG